MPIPFAVQRFLTLWRPEVLVAMLALQALYLVALNRGRRRGLEPPSRLRQAGFSLGLLAIYVAEGTPVHVLAESYLFSMHMVQHLLMVQLAPALLLIGTPGWLLRPLFRRAPVQAAARRLLHPLVGLLAFNLLFSLYHVPSLYQAGLQQPGVHFFQHGLLTAAGFLMWWPVFSPLPAYRLTEGLQILYLFAQGVAQTAVFAMVTYAEHPLYHRYAQAPRVLPLTPLQDQAAGGFIMREVSMLVLFIPLLLAFSRWVKRELAQYPLDPPPTTPPSPGAR